MTQSSGLRLRADTPVAVTFIVPVALPARLSDPREDECDDDERCHQKNDREAVRFGR